MVRNVIAFLLLAAAPAALASAETSEGGDWGLSQVPDGCMVHASSPQGTVVSIWGFAGQDKLGVLVQNRGWDSLQEGRQYQLKVAFDADKAWPVAATGRLNIDEDGPGLFFAVHPGSQSKEAGFFEAFAEAKGMDITRNGTKIDTVPLAGSRTAMVAFAQCLGQAWSAPAAQEEEETPAPAVPAA
ncbi:MAG: hypothetical protein E6G94_16165 [Alphaproteobacteria bacterium]|nr:MAG: hypothetical protein E6G94_16165 [Alphaproteobacteria bacterium]